MLSRLYAILDVDATACIAGDVTAELLAAMAASAVHAGAMTIQLRAKNAQPRTVLQYATAAASQNTCHRERSEGPALVFAGAQGVEQGQIPPLRCGMTTKENPHASVDFILNDRPDLALLAGFNGCHLGQEDLSIEGARRILPHPHLLGLSTHNEEQLVAGDATDADYLAIGPIFATASKQNAAPTIGLKELTRLRKLTRKPIVAIGGITAANARAVLDAGADSVAVLGALLAGADSAASLPDAVARNCADILVKIL